MSSRLSDDFHPGSQPVSSLIAANASRLRVSSPESPSTTPPSASEPNSTAYLMALEIQNRELRASLRKAEQQRSRYFELFESSPIAYFIFDERHHLHDLNLAAGMLLPGERSKLKHRPFFPHLTDTDRTRFHRHLTEVFRDRTESSISLKLVNGSSEPRVYRFLSQTAPSTPGEPPMVLSAVLRESDPTNASSTPVKHPAEGDAATARKSAEVEGNSGLHVCAQKTLMVKLPPNTERDMGAHPAPHNVATNSLDTGRILLVDDEAGVRMVIARMIESLGFAVDEVSGGEEALSRFAQSPGRYRWVVSDMNMPGMDGLFLARELKRQNPGLGRVIMSGLCELVSDSGMSSDPGIVFLQKPFTVPCLEEALMKVTPPSLVPFLPPAAMASGSVSRPGH